MERYAAVLNYAIPFFVFLIIIEIVMAKFMDAKVIRSMDTLSSLGSGVTNIIKDVLGLTFVIVSYEWMVDRIALFELEASWWVYLVAFIGLDFAGYWNHRLAHSVNYFWNHHIIHHSSEEFNLGCALRQSISNLFTIMAFLLIPVAILGVPKEIIAVVAPLHLFAQYWYHTRLIGKMGFLEHIIVTPSHHRVHHAINAEYMDKNMSQIFIIWDKLFGTFQEELDDVPPIYGVKRPIRSWNPIIINFTHLWLIVKDAWRTKSWVAKLKIWFMPTGWRPADVADKYPVASIQDVYAYQKYDPRVSIGLQVWAWFQFLFTFALTMFMFNNLAEIGFPGILVYGMFCIYAIFSYSWLMDKSVHAWWIELIKAVIGIVLIIVQGGWFNLGTVLPGGSYVLFGYFVLSFLVTVGFVFYELKPEQKKLAKQYVQS